jgi:hypothetical protein
MKSFSHSFLTSIRRASGNDAAPVTIEAVTEIRTKVPRSTPWTWAELNPP